LCSADACDGRDERGKLIGLIVGRQSCGRRRRLNNDDGECCRLYRGLKWRRYCFFIFYFFLHSTRAIIVLQKAAHTIYSSGVLCIKYCTRVHIYICVCMCIGVRWARINIYTHMCGECRVV
jgi:hypothetical protein